MGKVYARQVSPERQTSPLMWDDDDIFFPDNIVVWGNKDYKEYSIPIFDRVKAFLYSGVLGDLLVNPIFSTQCLNEKVIDLLPSEKKGGYSDEDIRKLKEIAINFYVYDGNGKDSKEEMMRLALSIVTGNKWHWRTIYGTTQGDWQEIFYPEDEWDEASLRKFQIEYFNLGTEWVIHDDDKAPESPEDINGYHAYCHSNDMEEIKKEIASEIGVYPEDVVLYFFKGYIRVATYKEAV